MPPESLPPRHPEVVVDLTGQEAKPVACVALVRRALQHAGHGEDARRFTEEALAAANDELVGIARRYVTVLG